MELEELQQKLKLAGLHVARVADNPLKEIRDDHLLLGTLEEYVEAVKAIGAPIVLLSAEILDDAWFEYEPEFIESGLDVGEAPDTDSQPIELCAIEPALRKFKVNIGSIGLIKLSATMRDGSLVLFVKQDWWESFSEIRDGAIEKADADVAAAQARSEAERAQKSREVLNALGELIHDPDFVRLRTQKAMIAFARERIPELQSVDDYELRVEVQNLHAMIQAKGLDRKR